MLFVKLTFYCACTLALLCVGGAYGLWTREALVELKERVYNPKKVRDWLHSVAVTLSGQTYSASGAWLVLHGCVLCVMVLFCITRLYD